MNSAFRLGRGGRYRALQAEYLTAEEIVVTAVFGEKPKKPIRGCSVRANRSPLASAYSDIYARVLRGNTSFETVHDKAGITGDCRNGDCPD